MIRFQAENCPMPSINQAQIARWIQEIAAHYEKKVGEINYIFCSDDQILYLNNNHLHHDYYTDIITFDYSDNQRISGDIYIGLETVFSNASTMGLNSSSELLRIIIHGILHLCGFKDKTPEEEAIIHQLEDLALNKIEFSVNL
jgi:probable rRNA maturation factor